MTLLSNTTINAKMWYRISAHMVMATNRNCAFKIAAEALQIWLILTDCKNSSTVPSPTAYDTPFRHNTRVTNIQTDDRQTDISYTRLDLTVGEKFLKSKLESNHSSQVPPPRQCYSPGGVTIFALPAVSLMLPSTQWDRKFQSDPESRIPAGSPPKLKHW